MAPIHDYNCSRCGAEFEELVASTDETVRCPHCDSLKVERLPSLIGGYMGDLGSASVKPRQAGSFKNKGKK